MWNRATLSSDLIRNWLYGRHRTSLSDTPPNLCREHTIARRRALAFRRGAPGRAARARIVERTSDVHGYRLLSRVSESHEIYDNSL